MDVQMPPHPQAPQMLHYAKVELAPDRQRSETPSNPAEQDVNEAEQKASSPAAAEPSSSSSPYASSPPLNPANTPQPSCAIPVNLLDKRKSSPAVLGLPLGLSEDAQAQLSLHLSQQRNSIEAAMLLANFNRLPPSTPASQKSVTDEDTGRRKPAWSSDDMSVDSDSSLHRQRRHSHDVKMTWASLPPTFTDRTTFLQDLSGSSSSTSSSASSFVAVKSEGEAVTGTKVTWTTHAQECKVEETAAAEHKHPGSPKTAADNQREYHHHHHPPQPYPYAHPMEPMPFPPPAHPSPAAHGIPPGGDRLPHHGMIHPLASSSSSNSSSAAATAADGDNQQQKNKDAAPAQSMPPPPYYPYSPYSSIPAHQMPPPPHHLPAGAPFAPPPPPPPPQQQQHHQLPPHHPHAQYYYPHGSKLPLPVPMEGMMRPPPGQYNLMPPGPPPPASKAPGRRKKARAESEEDDMANALEPGHPDFPDMSVQDIEAARNDPEARPRRQKLRYIGDLYTPQWVRYNGQAKEGLCDTCQPGKWLQLKNSAFWYHKQFYHGISSTSGKEFIQPLETRWVDQDLVEGLCHQCREWVPVSHVKRKNSVLWYRHAHKCHVYHKPKLSFNRKR